ncbi:hypothetical protein MARBORIA2_05070 [Methanobrevibacter arboriphilus]|uniref:Uncharacterized protein n=1 Tax=Methanobrevibacter arboriphilus TaxID=39441 RepID=A0ACA8R166_METAZ|nr:hypothetical protein MarbSA_02900 [Methanobrevibacter arboriphilus]GLI11417.1 hypothetical protein MARBORIA2_05070 [Methanobrevibacter arboriphilus]
MTPPLVIFANPSFKTSVPFFIHILLKLPISYHHNKNIIIKNIIKNIVINIVTNIIINIINFLLLTFMKVIN